MKYAHIERERRYLVLGSEDKNTPMRNLLIYDRYLIESSLRLRRIEEEGRSIVFKLGQKIRIGEDHALKIAHTTIYITENEFNALLALPAKVLVKKRSIFPLDERFTGGKLAGTSSEDLLLMLTEYGAR